MSVTELPLQRIRTGRRTLEQPVSSLARLRYALDVDTATPERFLRSLPFADGDVTVGVENELQAAVVGRADRVDLPVSIRGSAFYRNLVKRAAAGETPPRLATALDAFMAESGEQTWDHSWIRLPSNSLCAYASRVLDLDLRASRRDPEGPWRTDADRFRTEITGQAGFRIPVSYLFKLSLAQAVGVGDDASSLVRRAASDAMRCYLNDNTSPETHSLYPSGPGTIMETGRAAASDTLQRFFLTTLLAQYANRTFRLRDHGQRVLVWFAPHTSVRQRRLNDLISDSLYRDLFMNPCLSGWEHGEAKHDYMVLCHQVLSRSRLHAISKLRDAGIITRNLVVLPSISNTSLTNNGQHVSVGSRKLTGLLADPASGFAAADEKRVGDLAIKIVEHFLPLFVGTVTAAPHRMDFHQFHPETVLGFLPHELDFTHLRMLWRRWQKKADLSVLGHPLTPFGPEALDSVLGRVLRLRGDFVPDFRLLDYLVCPKSTDESPALNGVSGNAERLKQDLSEEGVFDQRMSFYTLYRLREFGRIGFSGFEGRHYSVFPDPETDMTTAVALQSLVTLLAFRYILGPSGFSVGFLIGRKWARWPRNPGSTGL